MFPQAATRVSGPEWSECASKGLAVKTRKGDALLFYRCASPPLAAQQLCCRGRCALRHCPCVVRAAEPRHWQGKAGRRRGREYVHSSKLSNALQS